MRFQKSNAGNLKQREIPRRYHQHRQKNDELCKGRETQLAKFGPHPSPKFCWNVESGVWSGAIVSQSVTRVDLEKGYKHEYSAHLQRSVFIRARNGFLERYTYTSPSHLSTLSSDQPWNRDETNERISHRPWALCQVSKWNAIFPENRIRTNEEIVTKNHPLCKRYNTR